MKHFKILCLFLFVALAGCRGYVVGHTAGMSQLLIGEGVINIPKKSIAYDVKFPGL